MTTNTMPWLKLHSETKRNPKIRKLSLAGQAVFYNLLQEANENGNRGTFSDENMASLALEVADDDQELLKEVLDHLQRYGVLQRDTTGFLAFCNWSEYQSRKPSDMPEAVSERVRKHRASKKDVTPVTPPSGWPPEAFPSEDLTTVTPVTPPVTVTPVTRYTKVKRGVTPQDRELDKEIELDKDGKRNTTNVVTYTPPIVPPSNGKKKNSFEDNGLSGEEVWKEVLKYCNDMSNRGTGRDGKGTQLKTVAAMRLVTYDNVSKRITLEADLPSGEMRQDILVNNVFNSVRASWGWKPLVQWIEA